MKLIFKEDIVLFSLDRLHLFEITGPYVIPLLPTCIRMFTEKWE